MSGLKKVDNAAELHAIKARYIKVGLGTCNNIYLLERFLTERNSFRGAFLEEVNEGVICFLDRGTYYQLILSLPFGIEYCLPEMDKEICCEFITYSNRHLEQAEQFQMFLRRNGFELLCVFQELRYCAGQLHSGAKTQLQDVISHLEHLGLSLEPARPESREEIKCLIVNEIGKYDAIDCDETTWAEQIAQGNIIAIYRGDELAAFDFFQPTGSRYVVKPAYRGKRLGYIVTTAYLAGDQWEDSQEWLREWVAVDNEASQRTVANLGYTQTNRLRYRFIRYPRGEGLK